MLFNPFEINRAIFLTSVLVPLLLTSDVEMTTSHLKRSIELLESDYSEPTHGKCKLGAKKKQRKSLTLKKGRREHSNWNSNESKAKEPCDFTEANISFLNILSSRQVDESTANKILVRAGKKKTEEACIPKDERTVFTEEDFANFEKEYFVRGK
ncbi:hypothetical protein J437_LFUL015754 [Ladona fulva]|uniref:40S ribosomal protein S19-binding protein 1 n=1 Tax=Ladona fulva TaxID=123851 RepID=A0A8K0P951_LADFU|nr:hypothetical protein J437_LFUL015754 [Ladona fulva]